MSICVAFCILIYPYTKIPLFHYTVSKSPDVSYLIAGSPNLARTVPKKLYIIDCCRGGSSQEKVPIWWKRKQWREQSPLDVYAEANITIKSMKEGRIPDLTLRLCPDWTGAKKSGRPKKGARYKSGLEKAMAKGKPGVKKVSATKRRRCLVCGKFGHDSEGCWLLEKGEDVEPAVVHTLSIAEKMEMDDEGHNEEGKEGSV